MGGEVKGDREREGEGRRERGREWGEGEGGRRGREREREGEIVYECKGVMLYLGLLWFLSIVGKH